MTTKTRKVTTVDGYIYLASPYSHPDPVVRQQRYEAVLVKTAGLLAAGHIIYSPIVHCHPCQQLAELPTDFAYWQRFCTTMVSAAERLWVLRLEGWEDSVGVRAEIEIASDLGKPVEYID